MSVYIASIILPARFVLAQGHTGAVRAKSFIVKEFSAAFRNVHIWSQDTLEPFRVLKRDIDGHFLFMFLEKHIFVQLLFPDTKPHRTQPHPVPKHAEHNT